MSADEEMYDVSDEEFEEKSFVDSPEVLTKYQAAAEITNKALEHVLARLQPGTCIVDLCNASDAFIADATAKTYNKGKDKIEKGLAFPTCLSINQIVGHFSPLSGDKNILSEGDLVKIDLGCHIDGYIAVVAHTATVPTSAPVTGRKADVLAAAYTAAEAAQRMLKPGTKNSAFTEMFAKVAATFGCNVVQGVLSHQMKRFVIDGNNCIISKSDVDHKVDEFELEVGQCIAIDVVMSTGEGKPIEKDERATVFKRAVDVNYNLKLKASRQILSEISNRSPTFPFTLRAFDEKTGRLGISECLKHGLVVPYPVLYEKDGEFVAQFKFTALIMPTGTLRITNSNVDRSLIQTQYKVEDPELLELLAQSLDKKKKKKKKAKKAKSAADAEDDDDEMDDS